MDARTFVNMGKVLPEFWAVTSEEGANMRAETKLCRSRKVTFPRGSSVTGYMSVS